MYVAATCSLVHGLQFSRAHDGRFIGRVALRMIGRILSTQSESCGKSSEYGSAVIEIATIV
jgi:hypothetical protein